MATTKKLLPETDRVKLVLRLDLPPGEGALRLEVLLAEIADKVGGTVGRNELGNGGTRILRRVKIR